MANKWAAPNVARYQNPAYDRLAVEAAGELDPEKRAQILLQQQQLLHDDAVVIPLVARRAAFGYASDITGIAPSPWASLVWNIANWARG